MVIFMLGTNYVFQICTSIVTVLDDWSHSLDWACGRACEWTAAVVTDKVKTIFPSQSSGKLGDVGIAVTSRSLKLPPIDCLFNIFLI